METLENTLTLTHDWAIDRIHTLCESNLENAYSIQCEFAEWLDPKIEDHEIYSLEYLGDTDD